MSKIQIACDQCTCGVMDQANPHLHGLCKCLCHNSVIESNHILAYCDFCEDDTVICKTCKIPCCSSEYSDLDKCNDCPDAWTMEQLWRNDHASVRFLGIMCGI